MATNIWNDSGGFYILPAVIPIDVQSASSLAGRIIKDGNMNKKFAGEIFT
ncbi:MAG: hypothetical protein ABI237_12510 [Ginsengibacter sp.]